MSPFEAVLDLIESMVKFTNFEEIISELPDKSIDFPLLIELLSVLSDSLEYETEEEQEIIREFIEIYEEVRDKMVYVPFVAFIRKYVEFLDVLIQYNEDKDKEFVFVLPSEAFQPSLSIKSNIVFTAIAISYLKKKNKMHIISGLLSGKSLYTINPLKYKTFCIFRNKGKDFLPLSDRTVAQNTNENTIFIYCDDGLYSGEQFELCEEWCEDINVPLVPFIPYMRENYVPKHVFPDKKYRLKYERFPLAEKINRGDLCSTAKFNVLGYFQHKVPDNLSISNCIPFLKTLANNVAIPFLEYSSIIKNVKPHKSGDVKTEYKSITYLNNVCFDVDRKSFFICDTRNLRNVINGFQKEDFEKILEEWLSNSQEIKEMRQMFERKSRKIR